MVDNDDAGALKKRGALGFFASKLAPTRDLRCLQRQKKPRDRM